MSQLPTLPLSNEVDAIDFLESYARAETLENPPGGRVVVGGNAHAYHTLDGGDE